MCVCLCVFVFGFVCLFVFGCCAFCVGPNRVVQSTMKGSSNAQIVLQFAPKHVIVGYLISLLGIFKLAIRAQAHQHRYELLCLSSSATPSRNRDARASPGQK